MLSLSNVWGVITQRGIHFFFYLLLELAVRGNTKEATVKK